MIIEYKGKKPKISPSAFIAPTAVIIGDVTIGDEASVWWGAVIRSDQNQNPIVVGARTSIQDNCVLHSGEAPTIIEEDCTIGHGAIMEGPLIKRGAIIGMNVTLLENVEIGEEALIAAGSVVVPHTKIPPRVLAAGAPAKVKKELAGEALRRDIDPAREANRPTRFTERVDAIQQDAPARVLVESGEKIDQRGLSGTRRAQQRDRLAGSHMEGNILQDIRLAIRIHERDVFKDEIALERNLGLMVTIEQGLALLADHFHQTPVRHHSSGS